MSFTMTAVFTDISAQSNMTTENIPRAIPTIEAFARPFMVA